jgi:hypothetical protein
VGRSGPESKPFQIPKQLVWEAYRRVKANKGAAGVDGRCLAEFESDLRNNLYKIWNRMSSGTYFPPPVRAVEIPKAAGGTRMLGVPTVADRVAHSLIHLGPPLTDAKPLGQSQVYRRPGDQPSSHRHEKASAKRAGAWPACRCRGVIVTVGPAGMSGSVTGPWSTAASTTRCYIPSSRMTRADRRSRPRPRCLAGDHPTYRQHRRRRPPRTRGLNLCPPSRYPVGAENLYHLGRCPEGRGSVSSRVRRLEGWARGGMIFGLWA